jgi:hypothetical protein
MFALLSVIACVACVGPAGPVFHDEEYLRLGLDPRAEADSMIASYRERDEPLALRIEGHDFTALGFMDRGGVSTRTRVLTARGIELALDVELGNPLQSTTRYRLLAPPVAGTQDADGDGFEEVFVERRTRARICLLVYRVRDVGYVDPVDTTVEAFGRSWCPSAVDDIDHDGKAELIVDVSVTGFDERSFALRFPVFAGEHRFARDKNPPALARFIDAERATRLLDWQRARASADGAEVGELAVELAALSHLAGETTEAQLTSFDTALAGTKLKPNERAAAQRARQRIGRDWNPLRDAAGTSNAQAASGSPNVAVPVPAARPAQAELVHKRGP